MTTENSNFESILLASNPKLLVRASDGRCRELTLIENASIQVKNMNNPAGAPLVPADGIMAFNSLRFTGGAKSQFVQLLCGSGVKPPTLTLVISMSSVRNLPGQGGNGTWAQIVSNRVGGTNGFIFFGDASGLRFQLRINTGIIEVIIGNSYLKPQGSILHFTFDGRYLVARCDGVVRASADAGSARTISYPSIMSIVFNQGVDSNGNAVNLPGEYSADYDFCYFGIFDALSDAAITAQVAAYSSAKSLSGTALLDNGSPATKVVVSDWTGIRRADVTPSADGAWSADVPSGDYLVTALGPAGYRPIAHGPVTAVDP